MNKNGTYISPLAPRKRAITAAGLNFKKGCINDQFFNLKENKTNK